MQTQLTDEHKNSAPGRRADQILRKCVHCGFCNATCPTYQLFGDELDGPRGRIYQIKQLLEGEPATRKTQQHLDRCLTCLNCETTCPSGVEYGKLIDIGRDLVEQADLRTIDEKLFRRLIRETLAYPKRFTPLLKITQILRPLLFGHIKQQVAKPERSPSIGYPARTHTHKVLLLQGCVQPALSPTINAATARVLDKLGMQAILESPAGCCGALHHHTSASRESLDLIRARIDSWWPLIEDGVKNIVSTASGCGIHVKHYAELLAGDKDYCDKAAKISSLTRDIAEVLRDTNVEPLQTSTTKRKIAFHPPCTLQHGQKLNGLVESILTQIGFELTPIKDSHLCCGAAGSYTLLHPDISRQLGSNKLECLHAGNPDMIATANIGCQHHLAGISGQPVKHWIELLDEVI